MRLFRGLGLVAPQLAFAAVFDLSKLSWTLKNQNGSIVIPALVPSQVHLALLKAGIITEPLLGINGDNWRTSMEMSDLACHA
jgi:beta-mannosidase